MSAINFRSLRLGSAAALLFCGVTYTANSLGSSLETRISPSLLEVTISHDGQAVARGTAIAISREGWLMTSEKLVEAGEQITVGNRAIGVVSATIVASDPAADLALLYVDAKLHAATIAREEPAVGGIVSAVSAGDGAAVTFTSGALGQTHDAASPALSHNALFDVRGYGGPLINECGEVVGVDRTTENNSGHVFAAPQNYALAATIGQIQTLAARNSVKLKEAKSGCVPALNLAETRAQDAERRATALHSSQLATLKEKQQADADAAAARTEAVAAEKLAERRQRTAEAAKRTSERTRRLSYWGAGAAASLLLLAALAAYILVARQRARRRDAESEADAARLATLRATIPPEGARDLLLEGRTPDGETIAIKIPALALGEVHGGAVMGRSPDESEFVVNRQGVSRRHARLFMADSALMIEDLKSTNGTFLNGIAVNAAKAVQEGDQIRLDDLVLRLSYRDRKKAASA